MRKKREFKSSMMLYLVKKKMVILKIRKKKKLLEINYCKTSKKIIIWNKISNKMILILTNLTIIIINLIKIKIIINIILARV